MRAAVALGSNLGDRLEHLRSARAKIIGLPDVSEPFRFSPVYETDPIGCEPGAQKFFNAVMELDYSGQAQELLAALRAIEKSLGRDPAHRHNVSRTIDLDLLYLNNCTIDDANLELPHPRLHTRRFVLAPLADIRPDLILPRQTKSIYASLKELADNSAVVRVMDEW
jgi:2-amino-4-hydroxy-6-hydroxymethyldihydropteridine diphosphokinase